ncbi:MAG: acyl-CoA synthetase, partial [Microbacterium sp.]
MTGDHPTVRDRLLARADDDRPALAWREGDRIRTLSWREYVRAAASLAADVRARLAPDRPPHVGVLLPNGPTFALHLAAAGLGGHVVVGLNSTRRGEALQADIVKSDCQFVVDDPALPDLAAHPDPASVGAPTPDDLFMLIFTSGTSGDPKAVRVTHRKVTEPGAYLVEKLQLTGDDCHYVSMPLFHSNGVLAGWAPALTTGATCAVAPFSASGFLADVRDFGATYAHYVGKPLAYVLSTPERPDDRVLGRAEAVDH